MLKYSVDRGFLFSVSHSPALICRCSSFLLMSINWAIIGCGDVAEVKSGPAFKKAPNSDLVAVMRRDKAKAEDFAKRHGVARFYDDATAILEDPSIDAVYVATPPSSHLGYALQVLAADKHLYLEKPMALSADECNKINEAAKASKGKLVVAHYRRGWPMFQKVKQMLTDGFLGEVRMAQINIIQGFNPDVGWRIDPGVSGGGIFHDLAPHHLDIMLWLFGETDSFAGFSKKQNPAASADDCVAGTIGFKSGVAFTGSWNFSGVGVEDLDECRIIGEKGSLTFNFFGDTIVTSIGGESNVLKFELPEHMQQPMIESVNDYFSGKTDLCPCSGEDGLKTLEIIEAFTA